MLNLPTKQGLLLVELYDSSPLVAAGVRGAQQEATPGNQRLSVGGDILAAVGGQPIASLDVLQILLETRYRVGDAVTLTVIREGEEIDVAVRLTEEPAQ